MIGERWYRVGGNAGTRITETTLTGNYQCASVDVGNVHRLTLWDHFWVLYKYSILQIFDRKI